MSEKDNIMGNLMEPLPMVRVMLLYMIERNPEVSGYSLITLIAEFSGDMVELRTGTVYNELRKLEKNGFLVSTQEKTSRKRREYTITKNGTKELHRLMSIVRKKVENILEPLTKSYFE